MMASQVLPLGVLADRLEDLFEPLDLLLGLAFMLLEGRLESSDCAAFAILGSAVRIFFSAK
jgi:hypothetical protein